MNIEAIIEDIESDIDNIKGLTYVPDDAKMDVLSKLREISDELDRWIDEYPEEDEECSDDFEDEM